MSYIAGALGVSVAAIYYVMVLQEQRRNTSQNLETRQAQLLMQIYEQVNNREYQRDWSETIFYWKYNGWDDYWEKYGSKIDEYLKLLHVLNTLNGIGTVLENRLVNPKMLYDLMGRDVLTFWEKFGPMVKHYSEMSNDPKNLNKVQFLNDEMSKLYEFEAGHGYLIRIRSVEDGRSVLSGIIYPEKCERFP